jgi:Tol biopolymer transport system component
MNQDQIKKHSTAPNEISVPYLGQTPPGKTPVIFAEGIISKGDVHSRLVISPDGKELFWTTFEFLPEGRIARTWQLIDKNGTWTGTQIPPFMAKGMTSGCVFSPDGKQLFFNCTEDVDLGWKTLYVEKTDLGWSAPKDDGFLLKPSASFTQSGMAYFSADMPGKPWSSGIYSARYSDTGYADIHALDSTINSPYIDYTPYISSEGDYLMFSSSRPSMDEDMYLFISFKNDNGTWSKPKKMSENIGFSGRARFPSISPDGKYIFFCGDDGNIYWVNRAIVDQFKP